MITITTSKFIGHLHLTAYSTKRTWVSSNMRPGYWTISLNRLCWWTLFHRLAPCPLPWHLAEKQASPLQIGTLSLSLRCFKLCKILSVGMSQKMKAKMLLFVKTSRIQLWEIIHRWTQLHRILQCKKTPRPWVIQQIPLQSVFQWDLHSSVRLSHRSSDQIGLPYSTQKIPFLLSPAKCLNDPTTGR